MTASPTNGDLFKAKVVTRKTVEKVPGTLRSDPTVAVFASAAGGPVDLAAPVRAGRHTAAIPAAPKAMSGSGKAAVDTVIRLAHPVRR